MVLVTRKLDEFSYRLISGRSICYKYVRKIRDVYNYAGNFRRSQTPGQRDTLPISYSIDAFLVSDLVISVPKLLSLQGLRPVVKMLVV